jgi:putative transposase
MGRKPRIQYYGAIYHIMQKGKNEEKILLEDEDKSYLLELINEAKETKGFRIFAFLIMDNCYHLLVQALNVPISNIMHYINFKYARYYNRKSKRKGPVFHERYKSALIQDERFLLPILKYIHRYPVKTGLCNSIEEYKWSSHVFYRVNMENVVNIEHILNMFSANRIEAIERYTEYMETEEENWISIKYRFENSPIIGTDKFIMRMQGKKYKQSLDELLKRCCPTEEEFKLIKNGSRERYLTNYKVEYISLAKREGYTYKEIGENIGITGAAARSLIVENK